jgi:VIT1/CCC1 family predicted Fe2+/Mn2+ transporter
MGALVPKMSNYAAGVSLGSVRPAWSREVDARRLDESIREEQNLKEKLATVEAEINRLTYDLDKQSKPVGILPAVWILSLLSLLGIVLPVVVMAFSPTKITVVVAVILIGAFILGLGAVLGYIVWYLKKISS